MSAPAVDTDTRLATRALLMLLVILGHNIVFRINFYYSVYLFIYGFHVGTFFLLTFAARPRLLDGELMASLSRKLYLPFLAAVLVYGMGYLLLKAPHDPEGLRRWGAALLRALTLQTSPALDKATGLKMLWFLPSFIVFCILRDAWADQPGAGGASAAGRHRRAALLVVAVCAHAGLGLLSPSTLALVPMGAAIALFLLLPGLVFAKAHALLSRPHVLPFVIGAFAVSSMAQLRFRLDVVLADFDIPAADHPLLLVLADVQLILGATLCLALGRALRGIGPLRLFGRHSLAIYLVHPPFNLLFATLVQPRLPLVSGIVICTVLTAVSALATAVMLDRVWRMPLPASWRFRRGALGQA